MSAPLRLADLLAEESFALDLLSGGDEAAEREVRGAHAVEVEAPARWLGRDWVMLTTGVRLRGNVEGPEAAIGVGREVMAMADARHSLRDAELAAGHGPGITHFDDVDLGTFVVSEIPAARLGPKVDEILAALRANPPLHEALRAYFAHDLDIAAAAASLHMHRNSLRYRLARAEQVLGRSLKQPATITAVYLALVADAAGQSPPPGLDGTRLPAGARAP